MITVAMSYGWRLIPVNSKPKVIACYYIQCVMRVGAVQSSCKQTGGLNSHIEGMKIFLRSEHADAFAGNKSSMYGRSTANWALIPVGYPSQTERAVLHFSSDFWIWSLMQFCFLRLVQVGYVCITPKD